jgi:adenine-specific DNA-methyltransferase
MLQHLLYTCGIKDNDIVMDFFSGSGSFAHAVMEYNVNNNIHANYITVQIPAVISENDDLAKLGIKNIVEVGKQRLNNIASQYEGKNKEFDNGFRVLQLDTSNMKDIYYNPAETQQTIMDILSDNIKEDRTPEDLLFQVMLDLGVLLSSKIEETLIAGKKVFIVADGFLIACFDKDVTEEAVIAVAQKQPLYAVFRDSSMANDTVATNFEQIFATYSPETVRKVL